MREIVDDRPVQVLARLQLVDYGGELRQGARPRHVTLHSASGRKVDERAALGAYSPPRSAGAWSAAR